MIDEENRCELCKHILIDPICDDCYTHQLSYWMRDSIHDKTVHTALIKKLKKHYSFATISIGYCILCKRESSRVCMYCYFVFINSVLKNLSVSEEIKDNFKALFNYEIYEDRENPLFVAG